LELLKNNTEKHELHWFIYSWKQNYYTGNSRANWKESSPVGFTRCFLGPPRWLPWFIHVFLFELIRGSRARSSLVTLIIGTVTMFLEWTIYIKEVDMTRRKRIKHVSEVLTCFTILLLCCCAFSCLVVMCVNIGVVLWIKVNITLLWNEVTR
jgi:hypothetical protein